MEQADQRLFWEEGLDEMGALILPPLVVQLRQDSGVQKEPLVGHFLHVHAGNPFAVFGVRQNDMVRQHGGPRVVTNEADDGKDKICNTGPLTVPALHLLPVGMVRAFVRVLHDNGED